MGKSGIDPTEDIVDGRDDGTGDMISSSGGGPRLLSSGGFWGRY